MADKLASLVKLEGGPTNDNDVDLQNHLLFELSRVQVGGVYTVLKTKAPVTTAQYGKRYTLLGRLDYQTALAEFDELEPSSPEMSHAIASLEKEGIRAVYGRWLIDGNPRVLLIDVKAAQDKYLEQWKQEFEKASGVTLPVDDESDDALVFGRLVTWFFKEFLAEAKKKAVIAHFHEWPSGLAAFFIRNEKLNMSTIFTAHATVMGRDLCARGIDLYNEMQTIDVDSQEEHSSVFHRHRIERLSAQHCDILSTVSDITSLECEHLLGRKADIVLPNGMDLGFKRQMGYNESSTVRYNMKAKIADFVRGHFYGQLDSFDANRCLYFFTSGRYEYSNKGADMFIDSLARLNQRLKEQGPDSPTVVAFIVMRAKDASISAESLHRQAIVKSLHEAIDHIEESIKKRLLDRTLLWKNGDVVPTETELVTEAENSALRRRLYGIQRSGPPPVITHKISNPDEDPILNHLKRVNLLNDPSDKVKVVFHPDFLRSSSAILPIDYEDFCLAKGIPSIAANVSGFGSYMSKLLESVNGPEHGLYIVDRLKQSFDESVDQMTGFMYDFCQLQMRDRVDQRSNADRLSEFLDWNRLHVEYRRAWKMALRRKYSAAQGYFIDRKDILEMVPRSGRRANCFL
ncbi:unnamed protein product [Parascedosporium putredinis]|uniref:Glycogen [starch] synthase n=1 Tax=Parascedosporium putredinis TaxID=1442378 RepID=A0A9P1GYV8_9PEZI|nr:unnamed protein product [Parascedosporium putredinis]CAI7990320.1 unnamed protein product [Parascedosporium putredinis]